jgi:hypothetical protein
MEGPEDGSGVRPGAGGSGAPAAQAWVWAVGIAGIALVAGMTAVVFGFLVFGGGRGSPGPRPLPAPEPAPGEAGPAPDETAEVRALKDRIGALEIEVLQWKNRVREMDPDQAREVADRLASGDPEQADGARRVLEARGGLAGKVLSRKVLDLRDRVAALEAELSSERRRAEQAVRALQEGERQRQRAQETLRVGQLYERALRVQESGHPELAEKDYGEALAIDPNHAGALHGRGAARLALGNPEGALEDFTRACSVRPDFAPSHWMRGRTLMGLGKFREAEEAFARVLELEPGNLEARSAREEARRKRGE